MLNYFKIEYRTAACDEPFGREPKLKDSGSNDSLRQTQGLSLSKAAVSNIEGWFRFAHSFLIKWTVYIPSLFDIYYSILVRLYLEDSLFIIVKLKPLLRIT